MQSARLRILVVDSSKIGSEALYHFSPLSSCDLILTDDGVKPQDLERLRQACKVMVAE
jgi:DeoR family fructose operon transcriptional repressor